MGKQNTLDLAQRVAEAIAKAGEAKTTSDWDLKDGQKVIGTVPLHLRHLHNLLDELGGEVIVAYKQVENSKKCLDAARDLFFAAVKQHVPVTDDVASLAILKDWSVAASYRGEEDEDLPSGLAELLAKMTGARD